MDKSTVRLETQRTLHLDLVGGELQVYLFFPLSPCLLSRNGRICPGKHLAHSIVTLTAASILSTFDLVKKLDENGREIEPTRTALR